MVDSSQRKRRLRPKDEAQYYIRAASDKPGFEKRYVGVHKGMLTYFNISYTWTIQATF